MAKQIKAGDWVIRTASENDFFTTGKQYRVVEIRGDGALGIDQHDFTNCPFEYASHGRIWGKRQNFK